MPMTELARRRLIADATLFLVAVAWGLTFPLAKWILEALPPFTYLTARFALATLLLAPWAWRERRLAGSRTMRIAILAGFFLGVAYALQTFALQETSAGMAGFLTGLSVLLVPVLGLALGRRTRRVEWWGVGSATVGMALLTLQGAETPGLAEGLVLLCAVSLALQILTLGRAATEAPPLLLGFLQNGVVFLVCLALLPTEGVSSPPPALVWVAIAGMAVVASAFAVVAQSWAQRFTSPTHVGVLFAFEPVAAAVGGAIWLGERFTPAQWVGGVLILAGIVLANLEMRKNAGAER
jgi:drug/metabolite transporter (DMT)-like permease